MREREKEGRRGGEGVRERERWGMECICSQQIWVKISTLSASQQYINGTELPPLHSPLNYSYKSTHTHTHNKINELTRKHCQSSHPLCRSLEHVPPSQSLKNQTKTKTTTQTKRKQTINAS